MEYGKILAAANRRDEAAGRRPKLALRIFLSMLKHHRSLDLIGRVGVIAGALPGSKRFLPRRLRITGVPIRQGPRVRRPVAEPDVWLHTGCVMNSWFRSVHLASIALLEAARCAVATPRVEGACCGALHLHAGNEEEARQLAETVMASMPGDSPIVVNAAGCGAMLKEYGEFLGSREAVDFSERVVDIHEWIDLHADALRSRVEGAFPDDACPPVIVQEPCHLRNVQQILVGDTVEKFVRVRRLDDDGLCCGAGGAYSFLQPELAADIRARKSSAILRAGGDQKSIVVTANPGCHLHLAADGHQMVSSVEVIADSLGLKY
ncbi:MAG: (Fe-S)-binding protein [Actinomycetota bacterium]